VLRCRHISVLQCEIFLRREENFFRQGALQASASLQSHKFQNLAPAYRVWGMPFWCAVDDHFL